MLVQINATGLDEIRTFLAAHHKLGGAHFTPAMIRAWAADAEFQARAGNPPSIEIRAWDTVDGHVHEYTVSPDGVDLVSPPTWNDLWDALQETPAKWVETTEEMYWEMLEAVPPKRQNARKFLVGEAHHDNAQGEAVYACFKEHDGRFFARYATIAEYTDL